MTLHPIGYVLAYIVACVLLVPALPLTLGAGAIFGFVKGSIIVIIGATCGACAAFFASRTVLRRYVERRIASNRKMAAIDRAIASEGTKLMLLMRLSGFPPFTWINYALGLTGVKFIPYLLTTLIGIIPGTLAFVWAGAAGKKALSSSDQRVTLIITAAGAVLVIISIARLASRAVKSAIDLPAPENGGPHE